MALRVKDDGKSECHAVRVWIGVAPHGNIIPRATGQTSIRSFSTKELGKRTQEAKQMTAAMTAGAASRAKVDWHAINWRNVHQNVRRLQARIVQATKAGRWGKVKALQRLLTRSFSAKVLAVRRVTENHGKRTPGVDGITWNTPAKKAAAVDTLRRRGYRPQPARRVWIPKSNGQRRPLGILTMQDRAMQALYLLALDPVVETTSDPNSYGFRQERSTADAIEQCFNALSRKSSAVWILEGDLRRCFDRINHDWLVAYAPMDKAILQQWLKAGFMEQHVWYPTEEGSPQGGIISPALANLTLNGLEGMLDTHFARRRNARVHCIRFADDFVITGSSKALLEDEVRPLVDAFMRERGLELSQEKTTITHIADGFDFLGQNVRKYNDKLLIKPSKKNVSTFLRKVRAIIKANKQATAGHLIFQLNPLIRGWANYHRHVVSKKTFSTVDHAIFKALWRWARRRHPTKSAEWVQAKYFRTIGGQRGVFCGERPGTKGPAQIVRLVYAARVPIQRHIKIKGTANPYDPGWELYFEKRLGVKMSSDLKGRRQLLYLWTEQGGICPVCEQPITRLTGWHNHHIVWRTHGGADSAENRVLVHPNCHQQIHSHGLDVTKPRPSVGV
jgi:RNA-directed DNA polymerase